MWRGLYKVFRTSFGVISVITMIVLWSLISYYAISRIADSSSDSDGSYYAEDCNVYGINLHGDIVTYHTPESYDQEKVMIDQTSADDVMWVMKDAQSNDNIQAVVVEIDSYGGSGEAGEEMMRLFKDSSKPVVAFIRDAGLSAAYMAATGANTIFASKFSNIGSIGVSGSYLQETDKNNKEGLTYVDLSSGKYKDSCDPGRPLSDDEKAIMMRDIKIGHENFINIVAQNRNLDVEAVRNIADGSSVMGEQALTDGLIDKIGSLPDVENYLTKKLGEEVNICWQN